MQQNATGTRTLAGARRGHTQAALKMPRVFVRVCHKVSATARTFGH